VVLAARASVAGLVVASAAAAWAARVEAED